MTKYGRLALQVEGWVTGLQPVTVKNLSGNEKYGLGTVRLSGIILGNGKVLIRWEDSYLEFSYCGTV